MIWVHGGGWAKGDKATVGNLAQSFLNEGFILVSINYRLVPVVSFEEQAQDIATAIRWVIDHGRAYGGNPDSIFTIGHSAGAHLVALVATNEKYLEAKGLSLAALRGVVPLDTAVYDIPAFAARFGGKLPDLYAQPFSQDPARWKIASPSTHIQEGKSIPPMIVGYSGGQQPFANPNRAKDAEAFVSRLKTAGIMAEVVGAPEKTHEQIAREFGTPGDHVSERVFAFLAAVLKKSALPIPPTSTTNGFFPEDVRMGLTSNAYIDPEFLQNGGLVTFLDQQLGVWVGEINPCNDLFQSLSTRDQKVNMRISELSRFFNGSEWEQDHDGAAIFSPVIMQMARVSSCEFSHHRTNLNSPNLHTLPIFPIGSAARA
jgi:acetyl esterase/lipase